MLHEAIRAKPIVEHNNHFPGLPFDQVCLDFVEVYAKDIEAYKKSFWTRKVCGSHPNCAELQLLECNGCDDGEWVDNHPSYFGC